MFSALCKNCSSANKRLLILSSIVSVIYLLDQLSKQLVLSYLDKITNVSVIGNSLKLRIAFNEGGAFSTKIGPASFYTMIAIVIICVLLWYVFKESGKSNLFDFSLALILGGAFGNLSDRLHYGKVVDWIDVDFFNIHIDPGKFLFFNHGGYQLDRWPTFNIADAAIFVAMILLVFHVFFRRKKA